MDGVVELPARLHIEPPIRRLGAPHSWQTIYEVADAKRNGTPAPIHGGRTRENSGRGAHPDGDDGEAA